MAARVTVRLLATHGWRCHAWAVGKARLNCLMWVTLAIATSFREVARRVLRCARATTSSALPSAPTTALCISPLRVYQEEEGEEKEEGSEETTDTSVTFTVYALLGLLILMLLMFFLFSRRAKTI